MTNRPYITIACTTTIRPNRQRESRKQKNTCNNKLQTKNTERKYEQIRCSVLVKVKESEK
jgi:hypothetical protein